MTRPFVALFAFLVLLLLTIPFSFDFATSVVPGWHTTIFPPYFVWGTVVTITLLLVIIGYWLLLKHVDRISWTLFITHAILTVPIVIFLKFPAIFLDGEETNQTDLLKDISLRMKLIPVNWMLFTIGQILFVVYYIRTIRATNYKAT